MFLINKQSSVLLQQQEVDPVKELMQEYENKIQD